MKRSKLWTMAILIGLFAATGCDRGGEDEPEFSPLTPEQNKENIEQAGLEMLDEMKTMENEPAVETNVSFAYHLDMADPFANMKSEHKGLTKDPIAFGAVYATANLEKTGVQGIMKSMTVIPDEDPETINDLYLELVGTYEWDFTYQEWDFTPGGDKIIFLFPATKEGTTNNASYTIYYEGYFGANPIEEYDGDLPQKATAELLVDDASVFNYTLDVAYNTEGYPTSISTSLTIGDFVFQSSVANTNNAEFEGSFSYSHAGNVLLKIELGASGNWTMDNIEQNTHYYYEYYDEQNGEWVEVETTEAEAEQHDYYWEQVDVHKVIKDGNALFQFMDVKMVGAVDVESLGDAIMDLEDNYDWDTQEEEIVNKEVDAINEHLSMSVRYVDNDQVIALVEAYPVMDTYTYEEYYYDGEWHDTPKVVTETDYWVDFRLVYADGSKVDLETYFEEGFDDLFDDFEAYLDELEEKYSW